MFEDGDTHNVVLDHHYYWAFQADGQNKLEHWYEDTLYFAKLADHIKYEVWIGEWSLATDKCTQHLNGFNDGHP